MKRFFFLLITQTVVSVCFGQLNDEPAKPLRAKINLERRWSIETIPSSFVKGKAITLTFTVNDGSADIFVVDELNRKVSSFPGLIVSGSFNLPDALETGRYHVIMIVNGRRVARRSFTIVNPG
jgi:hypothetical protein